jgi:glycosyltransferase involved in cell wall biosynthesis
MVEVTTEERGGRIATGMRKLKVGISVWSFAPNTGGLQSHAQLLCQYLQRSGHDVTVITRSASRMPKGGDYLFFNEGFAPLHVEGIPVSPLRLSKKWSPVLWLILKMAARKPTNAMAATLFEGVARLPATKAFAGYDVIHHIGHATALVGLASARASRFHQIPFLVQPTAHPMNFGDSTLDFRLYRQANRLLTHTHYERDYFLKHGITVPVDVVGNGIENRSDGQGSRFREKYGVKGLMILYIGRKTVDKGYPLVVEAFHRLQKEFPDLTLVCMGPPASSTKIQNVPGIIDFDFVTEETKHDALAACTCLCVPSEGESFGLVYMEAGRYRKPVVARDLPVLRELLGGGAAMLLGHLDAPRNTAKLSAEDLAAGVGQLLRSPELCQRIGVECYQRSESFLWPTIVKHFEASYFSSLQAKGCSKPA